MRRKSKKYEKKYEIEKKVWGFRKEKYEKNEKKYEIEEKVWEKVLDWKKSMRKSMRFQLKKNNSKGLQVY